MTRELFLSFGSKDRAVADIVVDNVERHTGWRFFQCTRTDDNPAGGDWTATISKRMEECLAMVLIYSENAKTKYVHREIEMAVAMEKPIVAIRLDETGWGSGVDYLMRTIQTPTVLRNNLSAYLPHLRRAIAHVLPSALALPLDSIADRQLKVEAVRHLANMFVAESGGARLHGLAVRLNGLDELFVASPCVASRTWDALCAALRQASAFERGHDGFALLPILSKEDVVLLVLVAAMARTETMCCAAMDDLRNGVVAELQRRNLTPTVKEAMLALEDQSEGQAFDRIAVWLTDLAKDTKLPAALSEAAISPATIAVGKPEALREALRTLVRSDKPPPRSLPLALTGAAAWIQFEVIGTTQRSYT